MLFAATMAAISVNAQNDSDLLFFSTVNYGPDSAKVVPATIKDGVIEIKAGAKVANAWDNQFFVTAPVALAAGNPYYFSMEIKAVSPATTSHQVHKEAGVYVAGPMFGKPNDWAHPVIVNFTTEWTKFEYSGEMLGTGQTIAFNLNEVDNANDYYIKNVKWNSASASFCDDSLSFVFVGATPSELKAENFTVFVNSVSSTAEFNALTSVSTTALTAVSTTVFASVSNTLDKVEVKNFDVDGNVVTFQLDQVLDKKTKLFVAYNNTVYSASYVKKPVSVEVAAVAEFSVYPNPVNDVLNVACEAGVANVAIFDVAGRMVKVSNEDVINVADLKAGLYIVKVTDMNGANGTTKIMK